MDIFWIFVLFCQKMAGFGDNWGVSNCLADCGGAENRGQLLWSHVKSQQPWAVSRSGKKSWIWGIRVGFWKWFFLCLFFNGFGVRDGYGGGRWACCW